MGPHSPVCVLVGLLWKAVGADGISRGSAAALPCIWVPMGPHWDVLGRPGLVKAPGGRWP